MNTTMNEMQLCAAAHALRPEPAALRGPTINQLAMTAAAARPTDALWRLPRGAVLTLPKATAPRRLRVVEGRLWLTEDARSEHERTEDRWLEPGDSVRLEPGRRVLAEGWPQASFELLEEPRVVTR